MTTQMALGGYHRIVDIFDVDISAPTSSAPSTPQPVASLSPDDPILIDQEPAPSSIRRGHKTAMTEAKQKELQAKYPWCRFSGGCNERGTPQAHCSTCLEHKPNSSLFAKASGGGGAVTCEAELAQHAKSKAHSEAIGMAQRAGGGASSIKAAVKAAKTTVVQGTYRRMVLAALFMVLWGHSAMSFAAHLQFATHTDTSTDVGIEDHLLLYVRYLEPSSFIYHTSFLCAVKVVGATSEHITAVIDTLSLDVGKLVAFCSDGASTFMGAHNGVMGAHNGGKRARKKSMSESMSRASQGQPTIEANVGELADRIAAAAAVAAAPGQDRMTTMAAFTNAAAHLVTLARSFPDPAPSATVILLVSDELPRVLNLQVSQALSLGKQLTKQEVVASLSKHFCWASAGTLFCERLW
ncbi:hypothetical protein QJQ45_000024 [Haematococcus lacustris]|nr:hypothetical protein QJQ45_000024 [Haematococcus lacustris]